MPTIFNQNQIKKITEFALEAGEIAAKFFKEKKFTILKKSDNSQVTSADIAVSKFLYEKLAHEFFDIPVICEERELRQVSAARFFLIDPIDGTSSFASNSVEFTVNIALVDNEKPVFGLIYAPLFEGGKMIFSDEKNQVISWDNLLLQKNEIIISKPDSTDLNKKPEELCIITSARTKAADIENFVTQIYPNFAENFAVERLSSAIKFIRLLEKQSSIYLHVRPSMEWDTASGQALVQLVGGKVKKLFFNQDQFLIGQELGYKKPSFLNGGFVASFIN
jgi:3'(2'), 5'-bisphosphate nucleotidase